MIILSHRGFWKTPEEKNTGTAFDRTIKCGFGTETDVRDCLGDLVISHDPPTGKELRFDEIIGEFDGLNLTLAINIKSDGLATKIGQTFGKSNIPWFAFDMSGPETLRYLDLGLPVFSRHSDVEPDPICYDVVDGIWLDAFHSDWFDDSVVRRHLGAGKKVCIVSPELHRRDPTSMWRSLRSSNIQDRSGVFICTDMPQQAHEFFGGP